MTAGGGRGSAAGGRGSRRSRSAAAPLAGRRGAGPGKAMRQGVFDREKKGCLSTAPMAAGEGFEPSHTESEF